MKIEEIKELVALLEQSGLNMLEISEGESRIRLEKAAPAPTCTTVPVPAFGTGMYGAPGMPGMAGLQPGGIPGAMAAGMMNSGTDGAGTISGGASAMAASAAGKAVKSPMVGVFYGRPSPDDDAFVSVGSHVEKGDVICIVEAMKLMNEIQAETSGEITEICVSDGDVVEYGQPLFYIK